jgi:hypothetical protein
MYGKVHKRRVPPQHRVAVNPKIEEQRQKEVAEARKETEKEQTRKETSSPSKKTAKPPPTKKKAAEKKEVKKTAEKDEAKGEAPKKAAAKKKAKAAGKKATKFPKWSPDDKRDVLYHLARRLDLDVGSRDTKDWIVDQLEKAEKRAAKSRGHS